MNLRFVWQAFAFMGFGLLFLQGAFSATLTVMPPTLRLSPPKVSEEVIVRNEGRAPVKIQVRLFRWEQRNGKDIYFPTNDVVASPPFITIKGNGDGIVRVGRISKQPLLKLESYRLFLDELPASRVRRTGQSGVNIEVITRQILPVIFSPAQQKSGAMSLAFRARAVKNGFEITVTNSGKQPVGISQVALLAGGKEVGRSDKSIGTVLPNSEYKFFVSARKGGKPQIIRIFRNGQATDFQIE